MSSFRTLRRGMVGDDVAQWQSFLIGQGEEPGPADGVFGEGTFLATQVFQERLGLNADGIVGGHTLGRALALGFAVFDDDDVSEDGLHWPPPPPFPPLSSNPARAAVFGRFDYEPAPTPNNPERIRVIGDWATRNIVQVELPRFGRVRFHKRAADQLAGLWKAWESEGLLNRVLSYEGTYVARFVRGSRTTLSNHAFGTAFDINARWNALGVVPARKGQRGSVRELVETAHRFGFYWGGHFSRPDGMHFEVAKILDDAPAGRSSDPIASEEVSSASETGMAFLLRTRDLSASAREAAIGEALLAGNTPPSLRGFVDVTLSKTIDGVSHQAVVRVSPDYLSIGTDEDFVRIPMFPATAQRVADAQNCVLPTRRIVDAIYAAAEVKLAPRPMTDGRRGSNDFYGRHQKLVEEKRAGRPLGSLTAGHKKDIVLSPRLRTRRDRVAIYGWHELDGDPIQPLSTVHSARYVDYSHGVRLVSRQMVVDGVARDITEVLRDPKLSALLSDEGPVSTARYQE